MTDHRDFFTESEQAFSEDLKRCISFHGHFCPGLVYGYRVAKEAIMRLDLTRAEDEEVVAISENDTCAVDSLQVLLGTTMGKGNLILKDYGKNVFTVFRRSDRRALRFSRHSRYTYEGERRDEFAQLEALFSAGRATAAQRERQKLLKSLDLLAKPFAEIYNVEEVALSAPPYAPLAPSVACARCGEMTMATKMVETEGGQRLCVPCSRGPA